METIKAIHTRHSVRAFKDDPIEPQLLTMIVTDAQQTPSWGNSQPWQVYIATGHALTNIKQHYATAAEQGMTEDADLAKVHRGDFSARDRLRPDHLLG
ncbi:nitroreductase family protein [Lactiplantibacillus plantarum]|uniref:nitroreductase family protein n=1 Tax=Lactiplantibacillus plantarum TaxID=1590 RepID=UPI0024B1BE1B|nr:nitroreductase family protein [Lactiplantibacillus plantarum]